MPVVCSHQCAAARGGLLTKHVRLCRYGYDLRVYLHPCNRRGVAVPVAGVLSFPVSLIVCI